MSDIFPVNQNNRICRFDQGVIGLEIPEATAELRAVLARVNTGEIQSAAAEAREIEERYGGIWVWDFVSDE
jgi:hypothetical protein